MSDDTSDAPGWEAIDKAFAQIYGAQEPLHFGLMPPPISGGVLYGISAYRSDLERPHWHFVTYGLTELYAKESRNAGISGYGFELTLRLPRTSETPPNWVLNLLENLANYVGRTGNIFNPGEQMSLKGPIARAEKTDLHAAIFVEDAQIAAITTPNGRVNFVQLVGITSDELNAAQQWNSNGLAGILRKSSDLLITDLTRHTSLSQPAAQQLLQEGLRRDGSNCGLLYVAEARGERRAASASAGAGNGVVMGANAVQSLLSLLPFRLPFGRTLDLQSNTHLLRFAPGAGNAVDVGEEETIVTLTPDGVDALLATLAVKAGIYKIGALPNAVFEIVQSVITDPQGNEIERIG